MEIIKQGSTSVLTLTFRDEANALVTPSAIRYRIDDVASGNQIKGWANATPNGNTLDILITANENSMIGNNTTREERLITVSFNYSADSKTQNDEYRYLIERISKLLQA